MREHYEGNDNMELNDEMLVKWGVWWTNSITVYLENNMNATRLKTLRAARGTKASTHQFFST